jgi:DNA-binding response OmpR family regulator
MAELDVTRILLVEDDESFAAAVVRYLRARGYEVQRVPSAEDARASLAGPSGVSLVILDINLPGESGWSLLRGPEYVAAGRPPVVVMTATHVHSSWLREFGVAGYLPKPFAMETLLATIERATGAKQPLPGGTPDEGDINVG